jgi:bifunctional non-homologous end joining protein LigD
MDGKIKPYIYLKDRSGLLALVQMGVLEIHPWGSTIQDINTPDRVIFDLDPAPDVPWIKVVAAANEMREHLDQLQLKSFVKTTGGKGLHVVVPILPEYSWDEVKLFSQSFVQSMEHLKPKEYITKMTKSLRTGKIYLDYLRNQHGATAISAYSTRALIHAPLSIPLAWDELSGEKEDNTFTIHNIYKRINNLQDPWKDFWTLKQSLDLEK